MKKGSKPLLSDEEEGYFEEKHQPLGFEATQSLLPHSQGNGPDPNPRQQKLECATHEIFHQERQKKADKLKGLLLHQEQAAFVWISGGPNTGVKGGIKP